MFTELIITLAVVWFFLAPVVGFFVGRTIRQADIEAERERQDTGWSW